MQPFDDLPPPSVESMARSLALTEHIREQMKQQGGLMAFSQFMEMALYFPALGYYHSPDFSIGKQGDFITAAELTPLYAQCFARQCVELFEQLSSTEILELGAGSGQFAFDLLSELNRLNALPRRYYIHEISETLRHKQQNFLKIACPSWYERIVWQEKLPASFTGMIIANEVLDALPVDCFQIHHQHALERCVAWENSQFIWKTRIPPDSNLKQRLEIFMKQYSFSDGYQSEISSRLPGFVHCLATTLSQGVILFADYGYGQREYYHPARKRGTLTCFYRHRRHDNPLIYPGLQDITAHVDFTRVIEMATEAGCQLAGFTTQAAFLMSLGLAERVREKESHCSPAEEFELHQAVKTLTLPTEMGERIKVMGLSKNLNKSLSSFSLLDRRRDL